MDSERMEGSEGRKRRRIKIGKKELLPVLIGILAVIAVIYFLWNFTKESAVCINSRCFQVELARTVEEKTKGLSLRENLSLDAGMLFVFEKEARYSFWMKDTLIPLDMIWINSSFDIVYIEDNAQPCSSQSCELLSPNGNARYILEINAGLAEKYGFSAGDKARIYIRK